LRLLGLHDMASQRLMNGQASLERRGRFAVQSPAVVLGVRQVVFPAAPLQTVHEVLPHTAFHRTFA
jgi:hypothetical protein